MFSNLSVIFTSVLITLAAAIPTTTPPVTPPTSNQCCSSVQSSSSSSVAAVAALLGLDLSGLDVPVGLGCSPITVIGNNWAERRSPVTRPSRRGEASSRSTAFPSLFESVGPVHGNFDRGAFGIEL
ncbi:hypothetical protein B0H17DRAFT_1324229 [Mycena rosella]|uniref:Hydrophobin n=1 Tax=Mycena rosella TaxID=1033263 RepID=A0AAD7MCB9_MYCRO|nr:hypothetical protein B0H17DRAFT_1324229 [Mycena rosella]